MKSVGASYTQDPTRALSLCVCGGVRRNLYHVVRAEAVLEVTHLEFVTMIAESIDCGNLVSMVLEAGDRSKSSVHLLNLQVPF